MKFRVNLSVRPILSLFIHKNHLFSAVPMSNPVGLGLSLYEGIAKIIHYFPYKDILTALLPIKGFNVHTLCFCL